MNQAPTNALYVNIVKAQSSIVDMNASTIDWYPSGPNPLSTIGAVVLRDMGKSVRLNDNTTLRKIQLVPTREGSGAMAAGGDEEYYTGYIKLGAGGGAFARAN